MMENIEKYLSRVDLEQLFFTSPGDMLRAAMLLSNSPHVKVVNGQ